MVADVAGVRAGARALERDGHARVALDRHVAQLHVPEERHAVRAPIFQRVGEHVDIHERAPVLAGAPLAELAVRVPQPDRGLAGIHTDAEHFPFELREQVAHLGRRRALDAEARLAGAEERVAVLAPAVLDRGELRGALHVEPLGVDPLVVVAGVHHHEAIEIELRLALGPGSRRSEQPGHQDRQQHHDSQCSVHRLPHGFGGSPATPDGRCAVWARSQARTFMRP